MQNHQNQTRNKGAGRHELVSAVPQSFVQFAMAQYGRCGMGQENGDEEITMAGRWHSHLSIRDFFDEP